MPETFVDKATSDVDQVDARQEALLEETRHATFKQDEERTNQERLEKARLRGKHALEKEVLYLILINLF